MISETKFMDCAGLPDEMCRFDESWYFVGEVGETRPYLKIICRKCRQCLRVGHVFDESVDRVESAFMQVNLRAYKFITDDMIEVTVYFGACEGCDSIYWARQGPPFQRVRYLVGAEL